MQIFILSLLYKTLYNSALIKQNLSRHIFDSSCQNIMKKRMFYQVVIERPKKIHFSSDFKIKYNKENSHLIT